MSRRVVINIMHNIYVYIHRSLNSRNVWPSESEKLERSEFVVVVLRCGGGKHRARDKLTIVSELVQDISDDDCCIRCQLLPLHTSGSAGWREVV